MYLEDGSNLLEKNTLLKDSNRTKKILKTMLCPPHTAIIPSSNSLISFSTTYNILY